MFYGPISGGVRTYISHKRRFLAARGHRHLLVVPAALHTVRDDAEGRTVTLRGLPVPGVPGYRMILGRRGAEATLVRERPDLVEVGDPYVLPWAAYRARARVGFPVVLFAHSDFVEAYVRPALGSAAASAAWAYARSVYRRADLVLAPSSAVAGTLASRGVPRVEVMPLGVDTARFRPGRRAAAELRRTLGDEARPVCLYVGRLSPEKGLDTLIAALPHLTAGGAALWVAGAGRLEGRLREAAARYPVRLMGFVADPERLAAIYAAADVLVVPGEHETFGLTTFEALASGTPVAAVAAGGPAAVITPEVGLLVPPRDPAALAGAALHLAADRGPARVAACRRLAEAHAWEPALTRLLARYTRLVAAHRGGGAAAVPEPDVGRRSA
jgi:glycosyltransferase involved in cell wall biosynthesis